MKKLAVKKPNIKESIKKGIQLEDAIKHPVFCFKYLHKNYHIDKCDVNEKVSFLSTIVKLSTITWQDIEFSGRHGAGSEKIPRNAINIELPKEISDDVPFFLALRFCGMKPFVGYRNRFIFHVLYIDRDLSLYKH